jgi:hypothetical protein
MSTKTPTPPTTAAVAPAAPVAPVAAARAPSSRKAAAKKPAAMPAGPVNASGQRKVHAEGCCHTGGKAARQGLCPAGQACKGRSGSKGCQADQGRHEAGQAGKACQGQEAQAGARPFHGDRGRLCSAGGPQAARGQAGRTGKKERPAARRHSPAHRAERYRLQGRARSVAAAQADCRKVRPARTETPRAGDAVAACAPCPASMHQSSSGVWTVTTTVCSTPSRSRLRTHQTAPLRTGHSGFCKPSKRDRVCPKVG